MLGSEYLNLSETFLCLFNRFNSTIPIRGYFYSSVCNSWRLQTFIITIPIEFFKRFKPNILISKNDDN